MKRASVFVLALLAIACTGSSRDPSPATGLRAFDQAAHAGAAFSASYVGSPPAGERPQIIITPAIAEPCAELYEDEEQADSKDFWFIKIFLAERSAGRYDIVDGEDPEAGQATATLQRALNGKTETRVPAVGGEVEVDEPVFEGDSELAVDLRLDFPAAPAMTVECNEDATADGKVSRTCICEQADGSRGECTSSSSQSCCRGDSDAGVESVKLSTTASYCARMCSALVGLEGYCHPL